MTSKRMKRIYPIYLTYPALIIYSIFFILPLLASIGISLTDWNIVRSEINFVGLYNFKALFNDNDFILATKNTFVVTFFMLILRNALGFCLALALTKSLITRNVLRTIFYLPSILSYVVIGLMFTAVFQMDGMLNEFIGIFSENNEIEWIGSIVRALWTIIALDVWKWTGFFMMIYIAGLQGIPAEYYEASKIDGASAFRQMIHITLPMLMPAININMTLSIIGGLKTFEGPLILTGGGPGKTTYVINFLIFRAFGSGFYGRATAMNLMFSLLVFILAMAVSGYFKNKEVIL